MEAIDHFARDQTNVDIANDERFGTFKAGQRQQPVDSRPHCSYVLLNLTRARIFDAPELQRNYGQRSAKLVSSSGNEQPLGSDQRSNTLEQTIDGAGETCRFARHLRNIEA